MADVAAPAAESTSQAAPGALLRGAAETASQDPSKVQQISQPGNPIRNLQVNPLESTLPATTPRMLNVVPAQSPSVDFSGVHSMLSSLPVPPPHVAASLIRAIMTPPGQAGVVAPRAALPQAPSMPSTSVGAPSSGSGVVAPRTYVPPTPSYTAAPSNAGNRGVSTPVSPSPTPTPQYHAASSGSMAPQTHQNVFGGMPFIPGTINAGENFLKDAGESLFTKGLGTVGRFLNPIADIASAYAFVNSLFGGHGFTPMSAE